MTERDGIGGEDFARIPADAELADYLRTEIVERYPAFAHGGIGRIGLSLASAEWRQIIGALEQLRGQQRPSAPAAPDQSVGVHPAGTETRTDGPHSVGYVSAGETVVAGRTFCNHGRFAHLCPICEPAERQRGPQAIPSGVHTPAPTKRPVLDSAGKIWRCAGCGQPTDNALDVDIGCCRACYEIRRVHWNLTHLVTGDVEKDLRVVDAFEREHGDALRGLGFKIEESRPPGETAVAELERTGQTGCANCGAPIVPTKHLWTMDGKYPVHLICPGDPAAPAPTGDECCHRNCLRVGLEHCVEALADVHAQCSSHPTNPDEYFRQAMRGGRPTPAPQEDSDAGR